MAREGIVTIIAALHALPPDAMTDQARMDFYRKCLLAYAWCVREEQLDAVVAAANSGTKITPRALDDMRAMTAGEAVSKLTELAHLVEFFTGREPTPTVN